MFSGLNNNTFGISISDFINADINCSAVSPLYFTKPKTAKGTAPNIHTHDIVSRLKCGFNIKYNRTATAQAMAENTNCLIDSPKNIVSL